MKFICTRTEKVAVVYTDSQNILCVLTRLHGVSYPFQAVRKMDFALEKFSRNLGHLDGCKRKPSIANYKKNLSDNRSLISGQTTASV